MKFQKLLCITAAAAMFISGAFITDTDNSVFFSPLPVSAEEGTLENGLTYEIDDDGATITSCDESATEIVIPEEIEGYPVTRIDTWALDNCSKLTKITLPDQLRYVCTFENCTLLKEIVVSENSTHFAVVDDVLYDKCISTLYCFPCGKTDTSYTVLDGVYCINTCAFAGNTHLTSVSLPDGLLYIFHAAFMKCTSLKSIVIPEGVSRIEGYAFRGCKKLSSVDLPDSLESVGMQAFTMTAIYNNASNGVVYIDGWAMDSKGTSSSTTLTIKSGTKGIAEAFGTMHSIKTLKLPSSLLYIGDSAFAGYKSLTKVVIPENVKTIGMWAFGECTKLTSVTFSEGMVSIEDSAFEKCTSLTSIMIPDNIKTIGNAAFKGCKSLKSVILPKNLNEISAFIFEDCTSLTSIDFPEKLQYISDYAFSGSSLTEANIPKGVTFIDRGVFADCASLVSVTMHNKINHIEENAFSNCTALTSVVLPKGLEYIDDSAFENCTELTSVTIYDKVSSINKSVFTGCDKLTIYGYSGSYAESFANENSIPFVAIEKEFISGDINDDGDVDIIDLALLKQFLLNKRKFDETRLKGADINGDGNVNVFDYIRIMQSIMKPQWEWWKRELY